MGACYSWARPCNVPPDPCGTTVATQTCSSTQTWFWILGLAVIGGVMLFKGKSR
jgi:hypothetical protein